MQRLLRPIDSPLDDKVLFFSKSPSFFFLSLRQIQNPKILAGSRPSRPASGSRDVTRADSGDTEAQALASRLLFLHAAEQRVVPELFNWGHGGFVFLLHWIVER